MNFRKIPFSDAAKESLKVCHERFITRLVDESREIASRSEVHIVSPIHVERANSNLYNCNSTSVSRYLGTIGGILLGSSLSTILAMALSETYTTLSVLLCVFMSIIGAFLIARHPTND